VTKTADKVADMSATYIDTALESHTKVIDGIINKYESTFEALADHVDDNSDKLKKYGEMLQSRLDKSAKSYNSSIENLFIVNSKQKLFFVLGIFGGIATPIVLLVREVANALSGIFG